MIGNDSVCQNCNPWSYAFFNFSSIHSNLVAFPMSIVWCLLRNCAKENEASCWTMSFSPLEQCSSLCEGAAVIYIGIADIGDEVLGSSTGKVMKRRGKRRRETGEGQTRRDRQRTLMNGMKDGPQRTLRRWANLWWKHMCKVHEKNVWGVSVYTHPSVTVDRHRLQTKRTVTKSSFKKNLMSSIPIPFRLVPPRCAPRGMPSLVLFWRNGLFTFSLDSWCKRFFIETAARKSDRNFTSLLLLWLVLGEIPSSLVSPLFLWSEMICMVLFLQFYLTLCTCSVHPFVSCDSR